LAISWNIKASYFRIYRDFISNRINENLLRSSIQSRTIFESALNSFLDMKTLMYLIFY